MSIWSSGHVHTEARRSILTVTDRGIVDTGCSVTVAFSKAILPVAWGVPTQRYMKSNLCPGSWLGRIAPPTCVAHRHVYGLHEASLVLLDEELLRRG